MWWCVVDGEGRAAAAEDTEIWAGDRERRWVIPRSRRSASACEGSSGKSLRSAIKKEISQVRGVGVRGS